MKFGSKKDALFSVVVFGINALLIGILVFEVINGSLNKGAYWSLITVLAVVGLLFWMYFGTNYELTKENELAYRSGPFHGKIKIGRITEIVKGKTLWVGLKPATSKNGLIIKYDKYNEIYISPKTNELFIQKILELNEQIKITE